LYGIHCADDVVFKLKDPFNIISVDPGRVELMHCVRLHQTQEALAVLDDCLAPLLPAHDNITEAARRRRAKHRFLKAENKSTFKLTNKQWKHDTGRLAHKKRTQKLHGTLALQPSVDILATATSKTTSLETHLLHVKARLQTAPAFMRLMGIKRTSRWKFETYQKEQRAVEKLSKAILGGMSPKNTLVAWGNGGFGPTSKGHDSAPNKKLRKLLSQFMPIVMNTEYKTSKLSCCCHVEVTKLVTESYNKRATVLRCDAQECGKLAVCGKLLGRDENAAHNILYIFQEQYKDDAAAVPIKFRPESRI
jgi:hypothetical protein